MITGRKPALPERNGRSNKGFASNVLHHMAFVTFRLAEAVELGENQGKSRLEACTTTQRNPP